MEFSQKPISVVLFYIHWHCHVYILLQRLSFHVVKLHEIQTTYTGNMKLRAVRNTCNDNDNELTDVVLQNRNWTFRMNLQIKLLSFNDAQTEKATLVCKSIDDLASKDLFTTTIKAFSQKLTVSVYQLKRAI